MALARSTQFVLGALLVGAVTVLVTTDNKEGRIEYMQVDELLARSDELRGEELQLHGKVVPGTVQKRTGDEVEYRFDIEFGGQIISIRHLNMVPDTFQEKGEVVLTGTLGQDNVFVSRDMTAKCPSKYEKAQQAGEQHPDSIPRGMAASQANEVSPDVAKDAPQS